MLNRRLIKHRVWILLCLCALNVRCQNDDYNDVVEEGRQLIQGLYINYTPTTPSSNPVDLIFILDRSASVTEPGWLSILRFVQNFLEHFTIDADNTRVAVISYSTTASLDIDGISSGQYNKCEFVSRLQRQMAKKVPSGYSATHDALIRAKDVALTARSSAKKAVIVITDGKSNIGPPPIRASVQLRSLTWDQGWNVSTNGPQLQVYAFGVKDAYMSEVRSIASPLPNHTYYIPTFQAFGQLARSLHDGNQSENWHVLSQPSPCNGICDDHASCACGTRSGQYLCICRDGYQGDGSTCTACPRGTYKNSISPSRCVLCPSNSTTLADGATDVKQCVCQPPLYQRTAGSPCQLRYCQDLPDIDHGHKFQVAGRVIDELPDTREPCQNLPDSSCHFHCEVGYRLDGHPGLVCLPNGSWEGDVPSCHIVDCGTLSYHHQEPVNATVEYVNHTTTYGSVVRVSCNRGWRSFGDRERACTHYGAWSGTQTWCVESKCPAVVLSPGLIITPASCGRAVQVPGAACQFMCEPGYELVGPQHVECSQHGTWGTSIPAECVDREPPSITCAADVTTPVTTANFAVIHWKSYPPLVTDNSGEFIITIIGVAESDDSLRLTAGFHRIKYIARDKAGNEAFCVQEITVLDFTVHLVTCPGVDVTINMTSHQQEAVWPAVVFADHNNVTVAHKCVPTNNSLLPAGIYTVTCVPDTQSYQQTHCQFKAIFRQPRCDTPPPPLHGSVSCAPTNTSLLTCVPHCKEGFDFFHLPQGAYICDLDGNWLLRKSGNFWPDCSRKYQVHKALLRGQAKYYYYSGQCESVKDEIALKFTALLQQQAWELCGMETCSVERVHVQCGVESKRKRRSAGQRIFTDESLAKVFMKNQVRVPSSLLKLLQEKRTETVSTETPQRKSSEASVEVHQKHQISTTISSLMNYPLEMREETVPTEKSHKTPYEATITNFLMGIRQGRHDMKRSVSKNYVLDETKNWDKSETNIGELPENDDLRESHYQNMTNVNGKHSDNKDKGSTNNKSELEGVFTIHINQPDTVIIPNNNLVRETSIEVLQYQDFHNSRVLDTTKETTGCGDCLGVRVKYNLLQEVDSSPHSAVSAAQKPELLLGSNVFSREMDVPSEQDVPHGDSSHLSFHKRSVEGITPDYENLHADYDHQIVPSASSTIPPLTYFLENVSPTSYQDEETDEVKIDFVITKEIFNITVDEDQQSEMLIVLLNIFRSLDTSLESHNLTLDNNNVTGADNGSNILYAHSHEIDYPNFDDCDFGYVNISAFPFTTQMCVACPAGSKYVVASNQCMVCPAAYYQPEEAQDVCLQCPDNAMTEFPGANNISMCLAVCNYGQFSGTGLSPCLSCPLHSYQPLSSATTCLPCPMGRKTLRTGAVHANECLDLCDPGLHSETGLLPCVPCPVGSYQPNHGATECLLCGDGLTTMIEQATNASECLAWDACSSTDLRCENNGTCIMENNMATCVCASGFSGTSCEINIPDCSVFSCQNNGTCMDGINTFTCDCLPGFTGSKCEVNIDACLSSPCQHGSSCLDLFNGYQCFCLYEYTGIHCETKMPLCNGSTCVNGQCEEQNGTTACVCSQGFAGNTCNTTIDLCSSHPCANADQCVPTSGHFQCQCLPGFTSALCDTVLDPCENSNCRRESLCIIAQSSQFGYLCKCPGGWSGEFCEHEVSADFDLVFSADSQDGQYVVLPPEFMPSLVDFTVCTWLRPQSLSAFATIVAFTLPLQLLTSEDNDYYVDGETKAFDTIFSIKHTDKLIVNIFNLSISTNVTLTFMVWSHLCVTWSCTSNHWQVVVNGSVSAEGTEDHLSPFLPPNVQVVLGQNNPYYAEASMLWEVFAGEITQFNIFSHILSLDNLSGLASGGTCNTTFGDVIRWSDVISYTKGDLVIRETSYCLDINECWFPLDFPCGNNRDCEDLIGSYNCSSCMYGYTGRNCEHPDDECAMDKCIRGECIDGPDPYDFQCICPPGFTGYLCEDMIDLCLSAPCQNGGICISRMNSFSCICPMEDMGPLCERPASVCFPNPCQNHGICIEMIADTFKCSCSENFTGRLCERRRHWCEDNVCHNEGVCQNKSMSLQNNMISRSQDESFCKCKNGWMGRQCEVKMVLTCDLYPCANGGTCLPLSESQQGYSCQCSNMPNVKVNENCEYLNPCDPSPCTNNTLCVQFSNYTFICLCVEESSCGSHDNKSTSNTSDQNQKITTSTSDSNLSSAAIWTITAVTVIFVLLIVPLTCCLLWRRQYNRSHEQIISMSDVDRGDLLNPAFHSEELQLEESIYAELGDDYALADDASAVEDFRSQQDNINSNNLNETSAGCYISPSSSVSFSSLRSSGSNKPCEEDDTIKPLLSDDYLKPAVLRIATSQDSKLVEAVSMNSNKVLPRLGISNEGFDPDDYVIQDNNRSRQNIRKMGSVNGNLVGVDIPSDKVCYVNGIDLHSESVHCTYLGENENENMNPAAVFESSGRNELPACDDRQTELAEARYVNFRPGVHQSEREHPKGQSFISSFSGNELQVNKNPGYISFENISAGELDTTSQHEAESLHEDTQTNQISISRTKSLKCTKLQKGLENAGTTTKPFANSYVPFTDVWNSESDGQSTSPKRSSTEQSDHSNVAKRGNSNFRKQNNVPHSIQTLADFLPNECASGQQLALPEKSPTSHERHKLSACLPAAPSTAAGNISDVDILEHHSPGVETNLGKAEIKSSRHQLQSQTSTSDIKHPFFQSVLSLSKPKEESEAHTETSRSHLVERSPSHHSTDGRKLSLNTELFPENVKLPSSEKLVSALSKFAKPHPGQTPALLPKETLKAASMKKSLSEDSLDPSRVSPSNLISVTLSQKTNSSSLKTSLPLPSKSLSLLSQSGQNEPSISAHPTSKIEDKGKIKAVTDDLSPKVSSAENAKLQEKQRTNEMSGNVVLKNYVDDKAVGKKNMAHTNINSKEAGHENSSFSSKQQLTRRRASGDKRVVAAGNTNFKENTTTGCITDPGAIASPDHHFQGRKLPPLPDA